MQKEKPFNLKSKLRRSVTSIQGHNKNRFLIQTIDEAGGKNEKKNFGCFSITTSPEK